MKNFHPNKIRRLVFDLDSISVDFDQSSWENFRKFISILEDRDYENVIISKSIDDANWKNFSRLSILKSSCEEVFHSNVSLSNPDVFWITEQSSLQKKLSNSTRNFAGSNSLTLKNGGLQYQNLYDLLEIFHPSRVTATDLSQKLLKLKIDSEKIPLLVGIGGPEECGHSFFVGELVDNLEDQEVLVSSIDLSQVLGIEYLMSDKTKTNIHAPLWISKEVRDWLIGEIIIPYREGKKVYIEDPPFFLKESELTIFPFFLAPEMILLIWGTTIFLPEFENLFDIKILLELSEKTAAARIFGLDDRQNFDQKFIDTYSKKEGRHYSNYLIENNVIEKIDYRIDFNNFYAFRFAEKI